MRQAKCYQPSDGKAVCIKDACGKCNGDGTSCADCAGTPNGGAYNDRCGKCDEKFENDCKADCTGVWGGSRIKDKCNKCGGKDACLDCKGIRYGRVRQPPPQSKHCTALAISRCHSCSACTSVAMERYITSVHTPRLATGPACVTWCTPQAFNDKCGKCVSNPTETCGRDCKGAWGGKAQRDFCGLCGGDNSTCVDCKGCGLAPSSQQPRRAHCTCGVGWSA